MSRALLAATLLALAACSRENGETPARPEGREAAMVARAVEDVEAARAEAAQPPPAPEDAPR